MLFFFAFHFSLYLTPNCRNWSPNYSVLVFTVFSVKKVVIYFLDKKKV
jgi:hypothetical protein